MVSGHLRERDRIYYMVLSYTDEERQAAYALPFHPSAREGQ